MAPWPVGESPKQPHRDKISEAKKGKKITPHTEDHKKAIGEAVKRAKKQKKGGS